MSLRAKSVAKIQYLKRKGHKHMLIRLLDLSNNAISTKKEVYFNLLNVIQVMCILTFSLFTGLALKTSYCFAADPAADQLAKKTNSDSLVLGGGCFWCMEALFDKLPGVKKTISGYSGGSTPSPNYKEVSSGKSGHLEVIKVEFDSKITNVSSLLEAFWQNIDPFNSEGQFCDIGPQYESAIFYASESQKRLAEESLKRQKELYKQEIVTQILPLNTFYPAEDYHQDYYLKNPTKYQAYKYACGRDKRIKEIKEFKK